jgi:hypothetical protein
MHVWSRRDAIAMERRHIREGEERIARQDVLMEEMIQKGQDKLALSAAELLGLLGECLELSRTRLRSLESGLGEPPYQTNDRSGLDESEPK